MGCAADLPLPSLYQVLRVHVENGRPLFDNVGFASNLHDRPCQQQRVLTENAMQGHLHPKILQNLIPTSKKLKLNQV